MNNTPATRPLVLVGVCLTACLVSGCLGKAPPVEQYLRVASATGQPCENIAESSTKTVVAVKPFTALDSLDRQAVQLGQGRVQSPSQAWYWEATPAALVTQSMVGRLGCSSGLAPVWPARSTTKAQRVLTGQVRAFGVDTAAQTLTVQVLLQLWEENQGAVLGAREFSATVRVAALNAQNVAEAGSAALADLTSQAVAWLEVQTKAHRP